jgi:heme-degrading monooxygenase HmoA
MSNDTGNRSRIGPPIARLWCGSTKADDADRYLEYLRETGLAEYARTAGHVDTITLRRVNEGRAEFLLVSLWESMDAVRAFAGADLERTVFYPADERYLVQREERVTHFEIVDHHRGTT